MTTNLIKKLYDGSTYQVLHEVRLSDTIAINTEVRRMHFVSYHFSYGDERCNE
jgi:hypothetical protein